MKGRTEMRKGNEMKLDKNEEERKGRCFMGDEEMQKQKGRHVKIGHDRIEKGRERQETRDVTKKKKKRILPTAAISVALTSSTAQMFKLLLFATHTPLPVLDVQRNSLAPSFQSY